MSITDTEPRDRPARAVAADLEAIDDGKRCLYRSLVAAVDMANWLNRAERLLMADELAEDFRWLSVRVEKMRMRLAGMIEGVADLRDAAKYG